MGDNNMPRAALRKKSCRTRMDSAANDRISQLTEDVLLIILSFLTVKDAVMTSMVSQKFRDLWRSISRCLNLEIPEKTKLAIARDYRNYSRLFDSEIVKQTDRVNGALCLHRVEHLDELRIGAYRNACSSTEIHHWINFAIQKGVEVFELKLDNAGSITPLPQHSFPSIETLVNLLDDNTWEDWLHLALEKKSKRPLEEGLHHLSRRNPKKHRRLEEQLHHTSRGNLEKHQLRSFCCLKSLSLGFIDVSDEIIYYFLSNCMFLEFLRVECSGALLNLEVADGLRLKCLEIIRCLNIKSLKIYSENLVSLVYIGPKIDVPFQNVPLNLLELAIGDEYCESFALECNKHMAYVSRLEALKFVVYSKLHASICQDPLVLFPEMINLRHLELQVPIGKSLMGYTAFFIACPFLSTFKMEYRLRRSFTETKAECAEREALDEQHEARKVPLQYLQKVELIGFHNQLTDIQFAKHLISMAVHLKKMVLKFRHHSGNLEAFSNVDKKLRGFLPAGAELVLLKT